MARASLLSCTAGTGSLNSQRVSCTAGTGNLKCALSPWSRYLLHTCRQILLCLNRHFISCTMRWRRSVPLWGLPVTRHQCYSPATATSLLHYCSPAEGRGLLIWFPCSTKHSTRHAVGAQCTSMVLKLTPLFCEDLNFKKDHKSSPVSWFVMVGILCSCLPHCN